MSITVNKLDISAMKRHTTILIVGKRGTGKSVLMRDLLYHLGRAFDFGVAFSPTESTRDMWAEIMPRPCIYPAFDCGVVEKMLELQRSSCRDPPQSLFCLLDDCLFDRQALRNKAISDLFMNGRHQRITLIVVAQDVMALGPELRGNVDYAFVFKDNLLTNRKKLYEHLFGVCGSYDRFSALMNATTDDRKCLVLDSTGDSNSVQRSVFWYRAALQLPKFYLCRRSFWRLTLKHSVPPGTVTQKSGGVRLVDPKPDSGGSSKTSCRERPREEGAATNSNSTGSHPEPRAADSRATETAKACCQTTTEQL